MENNVGGIYLGQQNINDTYRIENEQDESQAIEIFKTFYKGYKKVLLVFLFLF